MQASVVNFKGDTYSMICKQLKEERTSLTNGNYLVFASSLKLHLLKTCVKAKFPGLSTFMQEILHHYGSTCCKDSVQGFIIHALLKVGPRNFYYA